MTLLTTAAAGLLLRPQPLGVLPLPAGQLVLPDVDGAADVAAQLARGILPAVWPAALRFVELAARGRTAEALALVEGSPDPVLLLDAFVLDPTPERYAAAATPDVNLSALLAAAAFSVGLTDLAPAAEGLDGEVLAAVLLVQAAERLEHGTPAEARARLERAVSAACPEVPALAAQLLGTLASLDDPQDAPARYAEALALLPTGHQTQVRAELLYGRGVALQAVADGRPGVLKEAVRCYQQSLVVFRRETHPELFAEAQTNLALCHLATPMAEAGDTLRLGIAVQALRHALTVWDPEHHAAAWASVTLNLANALQYLPSTHQEENLVEAVEHYERLLDLRDAAVDPIGVARVLANQGNALAHLGIIDHAREKLLAAQALFTQAGDPGSAHAVQATLVELEAMTLVGGPS